VLIEGAAIGVEIAREVAARRRAEARVAPRARPAIERVEPRRIEEQWLTRRERVTSQRALARADGRRADVGGERRVAAEHRELGFVFASVHDRHAVFAGAVGRRGGGRRVDLIANRVGRIVHAGDDQQDASRRHTHQRTILQFDSRELVNRDRRAVREQRFDPSAGRLQSIARYERHSGRGRFGLTVAFERRRALDVREVRRYRRRLRRRLGGAVD
jgi:hypothetical protein